MKRLLDYYIIKKFLFSTFAIINAFLVIMIVVDIIDNIDTVISNSSHSIQIIYYYLYSLPYFISLALPMSLLIASIFTFGTLQNNNELTAIKASGISIRRISYPLLIIGMIFSLILFYFDNLIVTKYEDKRVQLEEKLNSTTSSKNTKPTKPSNTRISDFYSYNNGKLIRIKDFRTLEEKGINVTIYTFENSDLKVRIDIDVLSWDDQKNLWIAKNYKKTYRQAKLPNITEEKNKYISLNGLSPEDIIDASNLKKIRPEDMDYWELDNRITKLKENHLNYNKFLVNKYYKVAFSFIPFIMVLFGVSLSIQKPRSGYALGVGLSLLVIFLYMVLLKVGQDFALSEVGLKLTSNKEVVAFLSIWTVNILFLITGSILFFKSRT